MRRYPSGRVSGGTGITEHGIKAERLNARQRVINHKLAAIQRVRHVGFNVQTTGGHRHRRLITKYNARVRVLRQQRQANHTVTAAQIDDFAFEVIRQIFNKETRPDIKAGAGEDVRVVVDCPVSAFQRPAQGFWRVGQFRGTESTVNEARFFRPASWWLGRALSRTVPALRYGYHAPWPPR